MTKEYKFSVWQPENRERQVQTRDPGLGLVENALVEYGIIMSDVPIKIKVGIMEMRGSSLEEHTESITGLRGELFWKIGGIAFTEFEGTVLDGRDAVSTDFEVEIFGYRVKGSLVMAEYRGEAYRVSYEAEPGRYGEHAGQFGEVLDMFRFL